MKFKFSFKVHSNLLQNGTRYITEMPGLVKVKADNNTLAFLFEYEDNPSWKYAPSNAIVTGWNNVSLDGNDTKIILTVNSNTYTLIDESTAYNMTTITSSYGNYWYTINTPSLNTANTWEIKTQIKYIKDIDSNDAQWIIGNNDGYYTGPQLIIHSDGTIAVYASSDGSSFDLASDWASQIILTSGYIYEISIGYDNSDGYYVTSKNINSGTLQKETITTEITNIYCTSPIFFLGNPAGGNMYFRGVQYLNNTTITIDGDTWFDGSTAVENTDYTNNGCIESRETIYPEGQYPVIHTGQLKIYQSWLYLKDIEALKLDD